MANDENTAINDLIGLASRKPIADFDEPLFSSPPPSARPRPAPFGGNLSAIGASVAPLPRRRAPAATPTQVPVDYPDDDAATQIDPRAKFNANVTADTGPYVPARIPLPQASRLAPPPVRIEATVRREPPPILHAPPPPAGSYASPAPVHAAPVHAAPVHAAPVHAAPVHAAPVHAAPVAPALRESAARRAYYVGPSDAFHTVRVTRLPLETAAPSRGHKLLSAIERYWAPLAGLGLVATAFAGYLLIRGTSDAEAAGASSAPIAMTSASASSESARVSMKPLAAAIAGTDAPADPPSAAAMTDGPAAASAAAAITIEPIAAAPAAEPIAVPATAAAITPEAFAGAPPSAHPIAAVEAPIAVAPPAAPATATTAPIAAAPTAEAAAVPHASMWRPTTPQPTIMAPSESVATADSLDEIEMEPTPVAAPAKSAPAKTSRASKRAAAKRAKQVAAAERPKSARTRSAETRAKSVASAGPAETHEKPGKVVAIAAAKPMRIGATSAAAAKTGGAGKVTVTSTPSTLIYVDGRNTGMMTPRTLALPEGNHTITLLSPKDRIAKTIAVDIAAGKTAQIAKTFTK